MTEQPETVASMGGFDKGGQPAKVQQGLANHRAACLNLNNQVFANFQQQDKNQFLLSSTSCCL